MRPVATINGKDIYSDKQIRDVRNTRVTFDDTSWCDVSTGEVVNNGVGFIRLGAAGADGEQTSTSNSYRASSLEVRGLDADVEVKPCSGREMSVTIAGRKSGVKEIKATLHGKCLVLSSASSLRADGANVVISGGGGVSVVSYSGVNGVAGRSVVMNGAYHAEVKVGIEVPVGSSVQIDGVRGNVHVGDTEGPFVGSVCGAGDMSVGKVRATELSIQGSGDIRVAEVNGDLSVNIQGSGDVAVSRGAVPRLNMSIMGSGDATFGGSATDANLTVMGAGDIDVRHVTNRPHRSQLGSGDIRVANW